MTSLELGLIGNCQIAVLVDQNGRFVWGSLPRIDGDPSFCSLLDGRGDREDAFGFFEIEMAKLARVEQRYVENTAILETILCDHSGGIVRIVDFVPRYQQYGRSFHPIMVIRQIVPLAGAPVLRIRLRPAADYGARRPDVTHGSNHIRYNNGDFTLRLTTNASITAVLEERAFVVEDPLSLVIGPDETVTQSPQKLAREMYGETKAYWEGWTRALSLPFEWQEEVIRAAITLKLCTFEDTGAVIAGITTSIPEAANSGRNWDYRYCWLRDAYFVVHALNRLGATRTMEQYLRYIVNLATEGADKDLQPVYSISGDARLPERTVETLAGYRGMGPVRVGNQAYEQKQNDVYGAVVMAATRLFFDQRYVSRGDLSIFHRLERLGERAAKLFAEPDAGLWEYRGQQRVHSFSSVMCWAACDRLARIATHLKEDDRARYWAKHAKRMHAEIDRRAWSQDLGYFRESFDREEIDSSALLFHNLHFVDCADPRFASTVQAVGKALSRGKHLRRYVFRDDFGKPENAFNICTFWYVDALAAVGREDEARGIFEHMLSCRNSLGLLSEDLDPSTDELWGNFPQTYSMVGIINSAMRLSKSWEDAL